MSVIGATLALAKYSMGRAYSIHSQRVHRSKPDSKSGTLQTQIAQFGFNYVSNPSGGVTYPSSASHPVHTSATGHFTPRGTPKKQMSSTSHSYSRRKYYAKRRKYY